VPLRSLAALYVRGAAPLFPYPAGARAVAAPTYPWQRTRHWIGPRREAPSFADHRVRGAAVVPGAACLELALAEADTLVDVELERLVPAPAALALARDGAALTISARGQRCARGLVQPSSDESAPTAEAPTAIAARLAPVGDLYPRLGA